jgi:hypothetical protein
MDGASGGGGDVGDVPMSSGMAEGEEDSGASGEEDQEDAEDKLMLMITLNLGNGITWEGAWKEWHLGDPIPDLHGYTANFDASGHELQMILEAMRTARIEMPSGRIVFGEAFEPTE